VAGSYECGNERVAGSCESGNEQVVGSCECGNELSCFIERNLLTAEELLASQEQLHSIELVS